MKLLAGALLSHSHERERERARMKFAREGALADLDVGFIRPEWILASHLLVSPPAAGALD
tara:strand:+ start:94 stop:273 length:180 start_codon:yes stop_codon:yes gene_type:complete